MPYNKKFVRIYDKKFDISNIGLFKVNKRRRTKKEPNEKIKKFFIISKILKLTRIKNFDAGYEDEFLLWLKKNKVLDKGKNPLDILA